MMPGLQSWVGIEAANSRSQIVLIDPTSSQINDLISGLDYAYPQQPSSVALRHHNGLTVVVPQRPCGDWGGDRLDRG